MRTPFSNELPERNFLYSLDSMDFIQQMEFGALALEDMADKERGKQVAPDTTGVDYFFLTDFITEDMFYDFPLIEQDFLVKCSDKLNAFNEAGWYGDNSFRTNAPLKTMQGNILRLIYNGAKLKDEYCLTLIKNLYKIYHKKEYNQLKRFKTINPDEVLSLANDEHLGREYTSIGRIMGMCPLLGISLHDNCSLLYKQLNRIREDILSVEDEETDFEIFNDELFDECTKQVDEWLLEQDKKNQSYLNRNKKYWEISSFVGACFRQQGFPEDYAFLCMENNMGLRMQMIRTLATLKTWNKNKTFTFDEVQFYTNIYDLAAALSNVSEDFYYETGYLLGDRIEEADIEDALFNPVNMTVKTDNKKSEKKIITNVAPVNTADLSTDDYIAEIDRLRKIVNEKEQENKYLREQYKSIRHINTEKESLVRKYESERDELISLREYAYKQTHYDDIIKDDLIPDMEKAICNKKIVIIGGHEKWLNKLKTRFPEWLFISDDTYKTINAGILKDKERVYFYTDYISHTNYYKFIDIVRQKSIPFGYISGTNLENVISQIYKETNYDD